MSSIPTAQRLFLHVQRCGAAGATFDEASIELGILHEEGSGRWHDLIRSGCLVAVGIRKTTKGRGAKVYCVPEGASYLTYRSGSKKSDAQVRTDDQRLADAGKQFIRAYFTTADPTKRKMAMEKVLQDLVRIGRTQYDVIAKPE